MTPDLAATSILAAAGVALDAATFPMGCQVPDPTLRYITHNTPAVDNPCPAQLTVWIERIRPRDQANQGVNKCAYTWEATINVEIWSCITGMNDQGASPLPAVQEAEAQCLSQQIWAIVCDLTQQIIDMTLLPGIACKSIHIGDVQALGPDGNTAGYRWPLQVQVDCA